MVKITKEAALAYHENGRPGKIEVIPTKAHSTQTDLSLAYSPGVAYPCLEIQENPDNVYKYTDKGNLVAVITNGTAVLGLGNIGAMSGKPVMEGKGLLFKIYGGIDVFDIEINETDPDKSVKLLKRLLLRFGGINLEDIKAPECFAIEERLKRTFRHSGDARRPARHSHYICRWSEKCARGCWKRHNKGSTCCKWSRCCCHIVYKTICSFRLKEREYSYVRFARSYYCRPTELN